jgi:hypothetical protein
MILGFNNQFVKPILDGIKIHTIRDDTKRRWKEGNSIQMAIGVRTSKYYMFKEGVCTGIQNVEMSLTKSDTFILVAIDGRVLPFSELLLLSYRDGFNSLQGFIDWFLPLIKAAPNNIYNGVIIHWTDFKY